MSGEVDGGFSCDFDAPQYYMDFGALESGDLEDGEGDEWFDTKYAEEEGAALSELHETSSDEALQEEKSYRTPVVERTHHMILRPSTVEKSGCSDAKHSATPGKPRLTLPETPDFVRRGRQRRVAYNNTKTSEQIELERISQLRADRQKVIETSKSSFRNLQATSNATIAQLPKRTAQPPTIPVAFKFQTDNRLNKKEQDGSGGLSDENVSCFPHNLRQFSGKAPVKSSGPPALTQPKPFNLRSSRRAQMSTNKENATGKFTTAAERLHKFHTATPDRFRTQSRAAMERGPAPQPRGPTKITMPHTPNLRTRSRTRPVQVESTAARMEREAEEARKYQFKATKFDSRIVSENGGLGLPKRVAPKTTVPLPVRLATDKRVTKPKEDESDKSSFKAQPIPADMFDRVLGVPKRPAADCTDARTPNIRRCKRKAEDVLEAQAKRHLKETAKSPIWSPLKATVIEPFNLQTEVRGALNQRSFQAKVEAEEEVAKQQKQFKARPANVCYEAPFKPAPSGKAPVIPDDVVLNSDIRAEQRHLYEARKAERELQLAEEQHQRKMELERREKEEVEQMRRSRVHKAQPIRHYKPVEIQRGASHLTQPVSPSFSDRITAKYQKAHANS